MFFKQVAYVSTRANRAREAGRVALYFAQRYDTYPSVETRRDAERTAKAALKAADRAEEAAFAIDPVAADDNPILFETHCNAMEMAEFARKVAAAHARPA